MKTDTNHIKSALAIFKQYKKLADTSISRLNEEQFYNVPSPESNSIAIIVKHMAGNMKSRWTDFLTTDGEKSFRNRDNEFESQENREQLMASWEEGWNILFDTLTSLDDKNLKDIVTIRSEPHSVLEAINRQIAHYSYHVGQIVFLSKFLCGDHWDTLSIAKGKSNDFNQKMNHR